MQQREGRRVSKWRTGLVTASQGHSPSLKRLHDTRIQTGRLDAVEGAGTHLKFVGLSPTSMRLNHHGWGQLNEAGNNFE